MGKIVRSLRSSICFIFVAIASVMVVSNVSATPLPWLDFGDSFTWNGSDLYTDNSGSTEFVSSVAYQSGAVNNRFSATPDKVLDSEIFLDMSFDGLQNDTFEIAGWFTADVVLVATAFDPINAIPNPFIAMLDNISFTCGATCGDSQWYTQFASSIGGSIYDAQLRLDFSGSHNNGDGTYLINGGGKVAPVPEPGTVLLLGTGLVGLAFINRRRKEV